MSRIAECFNRLAGHKALIPFITAGDPNPKLTVELMHGLVDGGADIIELGVPFSDPMADGPVIQRASERALKHHVSLAQVLDMVATFRLENTYTPVVLMGYLNPVCAMGFQRFAERAAACGVDGVLTVDCPPEEADELTGALVAAGLDPIFLVAPTTPPDRVARIGQLARGYVYYVSLKGVTGAGHLDIAEVTGKIAALRESITVPIGVGFGIRDAETARALSGTADAIVVGSRLVQEIEAAEPQAAKQRLARLVAELKSAIR
ncbi:MAG: tryptophan synthase subunit alpha [Paludibacterium sp.]|uniref:tryptophan synthase subunit alpha n=1 Tax=Paludibacterium sp. TaxID=1917523 RepID=UPI0025EF5191|nr:tryptophan synthase subunit alpha [Paludibacterium sp.]MBV8047267.1 tryptophan synthase subunit alpha [Paludibacterium sp.]MBV8647287.1 tryptophan synthase subunit alpha [Paludibacterium sp.]